MSFPPVKRERKTSDHDLQSLLDLLDCGVVKISFDGEMKRSVLWANKGFYALTGRSKEEYEQQEKSGMGLIVVSHYARFYDYIKPTHAHVLLDGRIVVSGGEELIARVDQEGYEWIEEQYHVTSAKQPEKKPELLGSCGAHRGE